jgi:hypothetical protein
MTNDKPKKYGPFTRNEWIILLVVLVSIGAFAGLLYYNSNSNSNSTNLSPLYVMNNDESSGGPSWESPWLRKQGLLNLPDSPPRLRQGLIK